MTELRLGYLYGVAAYFCWGFFPLYWRLLRPTGPLEVLAHRIVWSTLFVALLLAALRNLGFLRSLLHRPRTLAGIFLAAVLIAVNWGTYIYGVDTERVVETALGYFITPLVAVLLGVTSLGERLRLAQWVALGLGTLAVVVLTVDYGRLPYLALLLAGSFAGYGLVKKRLGLPAAEGLLVESAALTLPALAYLGWLAWGGQLTLGQVSVGHTTLLVLAGVITAIPLLLFAGAANRLPMTTLGLLQYLAPILQLGVGVLIFHEPMPPARLAGFVLVWVALIAFTVDAVRHARRRPSGPVADRSTAGDQPVVTVDGPVDVTVGQPQRMS
ncbi:EamA family transporter RarD [Micromonospora yangpuensis]|uniref:Chloramphenicol-sensitive protein RarD n=1 Tax=Micromonospora yangpuensis TaxID=683228 RepID=A0A1C6TZR8_9ACTN|nr:EamA family transporter RarD [Micromonospora yangpuensis]GGM21502.1 protein RarD [Micromonospora yangpuensis]SCL47274.1 chloramphenicol-sensitive protein RarD [Micromonospora yangpuensis]